MIWLSTGARGRASSSFSSATTAVQLIGTTPACIKRSAAIRSTWGLHVPLASISGVHLKAVAHQRDRRRDQFGIGHDGRQDQLPPSQARNGGAGAFIGPQVDGGPVVRGSIPYDRKQFGQDRSIGVVYARGKEKDRHF